MPLTTVATPPLRPTPRQVLLGVFVVGQLAFLFLANGLTFYQHAQPYVTPELLPEVAKVIDRVLPGYPAKTGHAWDLPEELATTLRRWSQLTGQDQNWSLFAPGVFQVTGFPAVVLTWDPVPQSAPSLGRGLALFNADNPLQAAALANLLQLRSDEFETGPLTLACLSAAQLAPTTPLQAAALQAVLADQPAAAVFQSELVRCDNEPADRYRFFRIGLFRYRRFDGYVIPFLTHNPDETPAAERERWAERLREHVSRHAEAMEAYLKWHVARYRQTHPGRPLPRQAILIERTYAILPPEGDCSACWREMEVHLVARWQPPVTWQSDHRAIERYNPVTERFESVTR